MARMSERDSQPPPEDEGESEKGSLIKFIDL